jgi:hypothetical protein
MPSVIFVSGMIAFCVVIGMRIMTRVFRNTCMGSMVLTVYLNTPGSSMGYMFVMIVRVSRYKVILFRDSRALVGRSFSTILRWRYAQITWLLLGCRLCRGYLSR